MVDEKGLKQKPDKKWLTKIIFLSQPFETKILFKTKNGLHFLSGFCL